MLTEFVGRSFGTTSTPGGSGSSRRGFRGSTRSPTGRHHHLPAVGHLAGLFAGGAFEPPGGTEAPDSVGHEDGDGLSAVTAVDGEIAVEGAGAFVESVCPLASVLGPGGPCGRPSSPRRPCSTGAETCAGCALPPASAVAGFRTVLARVHGGTEEARRRRAARGRDRCPRRPRVRQAGPHQGRSAPFGALRRRRTASAAYAVP